MAALAARFDPARVVRATALAGLTIEHAVHQLSIVGLGETLSDELVEGLVERLRVAHGWAVRAQPHPREEHTVIGARQGALTPGEREGQEPGDGRSAEAPPSARAAWR